MVSVSSHDRDSLLDLSPLRFGAGGIASEEGYEQRTITACKSSLLVLTETNSLSVSMSTV